MDFKFRSMEERSSNFFSSSPNFPSPNVNNISYFSQQSIRAGFTSPDPVRREFTRNPNPNLNLIRESIQRELEKERIRAEIIAEEVYRRRILEDEVRREMMFEREIALRRGDGFGPSMRFGPRVPLLTSFETRIGVSPHREVRSLTLPFQRDPVVAAGNVEGNGLSLGVRLKEIKDIKSSNPEVNKDKVIFLAKSSATDMKRKATTPPPNGAPVDPCSVSKKPKTIEEWSCALCRVTATSKRALDDHLRGKKHRSRESGMNSQRTGFGTGPLPKMGNTSAGKPIKVPGAAINPSFKKKDEEEVGESSFGKGDNAPALPGIDNKITLILKKETSVEKNEIKEAAMPQKTPTCGKQKKRFKFFCETCQVGAYSLKVMNAHKRGKRHLAKAMELNETDEAASGETLAKKGASEEKEKETDIAGFVEKKVVEEKNGRDIAAVEEIKNEIMGEHVENNKKILVCDGTGVEDKDKVLEIGVDLVVAEKDDNNQLITSN